MWVGVCVYLYTYGCMHEVMNVCMYAIRMCVYVCVCIIHTYVYIG